MLRLKVIKKLPEKADEIKDKVFAKETLLTFITASALIANFILDLIVLIAHTCPFTVIVFILGLLLVGGIMFWYVRTRMKGEMTQVETTVYNKVFKKKESKENNENKDSK